MLRRFGLLITILAFSVAPVVKDIAFASTLGKPPLEIKVRVSEKGFLDGNGRLYNAKRVLTVPKDTLVTLTFVFSEELTSLAIGDTHQMAVKSDDGWKQESAQIWIMNRESSITFRTGENGGTRYRAYCILDCIGMEHLTNLVIEVVTT